MKHFSKKGWAFVLAVSAGLVWAEPVSAENRMMDLTIEVELQEDGAGTVTEHRQMAMDTGTELFIVMEDLQDSEVLDFSVAGFEELPEWDSGLSREEKTGKYGILETGDGMELVWGIGEYGENTYEVSYTLSNLVRELEDGQALLWNFDTFSDIPAENLSLRISASEPFTEETVRFWGFGFDGDIQLVDGEIVWEAFEEVDNSKDVTVLLQFPPGMFQTQTTIDSTLAEQRETAMEGSAYNDEASSDAIPIAIIATVAAAGIGAGGLAITYAVKVQKAKEAAGQMLTGTKRIQANEGILYEEIPFSDSDYAGIAYLLSQMSAGYFEDFFSAYLLKWANDGRVRIEASPGDSLLDEEFDTVIEIVNYEEERTRYTLRFKELVDQIPFRGHATYEAGLWIMLLDAADQTGLVTDDRIQRWAKKHADEVEVYANYLLDYSKDYLEENGFIRFEEVAVWGTTHEVAIANQEGERLFDRLIQFNNYLDEIDMEGFQEGRHGLTFDEYLLWSVLYFRSAEINQQFDTLIPDPTHYYMDPSYLYYYGYWNGMYGFRQNWSDGLASGGFHTASSWSAASGTGGSTSFGGGMGAGGGGGGGAR